ncbi:hypothetical protein CDN98_19295 [Roseateles terrae]|nr:hypothetical protein CDN98_19295 [Roseateles terrae]
MLSGGSSPPAASESASSPRGGGLSVAMRLWGAVGVVILALVLLMAFTTWRNSRTQAEASAVIGALDAKQDAAQLWSSLTTGAVLRVQASLISNDPLVNDTFKADITAAVERITKVQKDIQAMALTDEDKALMAKIAELRKTVTAASAKATELKTAGNLDAAREQVKSQFNPAVTAYLGALNDFVALQDKLKADEQQVLNAQRSSAVTIAWSVTVLIVLLLLVGAAWLVKSIQSPLQLALQLTQRIAEGDLTARATSHSRDEFGQLLQALDRMATELRRLVSEVRHGVDSVSTASGEIATGNHDLSARTEQTASNLQQTASSMEQLTATVTQSADTARQATQLASSAAEAAQRGGTVVTQVTDNMNEITASSRKISDIIGVIDGIAFQTNILALNAAVEAARAGEQGRGFAVVAGEVRTLAQRSAEAAKEIKALINASVERVEVGAELVAQSGAVMQDIVGSVRRVSDLIGEISAASTEQRDGIGLVNQAVTQLDQMTQQNAALVEESAAAAQSMREQAHRLMEVVGRFNVGSGEHFASTAKAQGRPPEKPMATSLAARSTGLSTGASTSSSTGSGTGLSTARTSASAGQPAKTSAPRMSKAPSAKGGTSTTAAHRPTGSSSAAAGTKGPSAQATRATSAASPPPAPAPRKPAADDDASGDWETF